MCSSITVLYYHYLWTVGTFVWSVDKDRCRKIQYQTVLSLVMLSYQLSTSKIVPKV